MASPSTASQPASPTETPKRRLRLALTTDQFELLFAGLRVEISRLPDKQRDPLVVLRMMVRLLLKNKRAQKIEMKRWVQASSDENDSILASIQDNADTETADRNENQTKFTALLGTEDLDPDA